MGYNKVMGKKSKLQPYPLTGVCDEETWNLDLTIAQFVLPRLLRFIRVSPSSYPANMTKKEWQGKLVEMKRAFQLLAGGKGVGLSRKREGCIIKRGLQLFADHFMDLWW